MILNHSKPKLHARSKKNFNLLTVFKKTIGISKYEDIRRILMVAIPMIDKKTKRGKPDSCLRRFQKGNCQT